MKHPEEPQSYYDALNRIANETCDHGAGFCPRDHARAALEMPPLMPESFDVSTPTRLIAERASLLEENERLRAENEDMRAMLRERGIKEPSHMIGGFQVWIDERGAMFSGSGRRLWLDCVGCGRPMPPAEINGRLAFTEAGPGARVACSSCGTLAPFTAIRKITLRKSRTHITGSQCGAACLSGKTSCDCKCRGRCHGAGSCSCGQVEPTQFERDGHGQLFSPSPTPPKGKIV